MGHLKNHLCRAVLAVPLAFYAGAALADAGSGRPLTPVPACESYEVRAGDTLVQIASRVTAPAMTADDLYQLNRDALRSPDLLTAGQLIRIPCNAGVVAVPRLPEPDGPELLSAPSWQANAGEGLVEVLIRWGREAGYDVIVENGSDWRFGVPFRHAGSFRGAVDEVLSGFSTAAVPPYVTFYTNNVMTIGAR